MKLFAKRVSQMPGERIDEDVPTSVGHTWKMDTMVPICGRGAVLFERLVKRAVFVFS